MILENSSGLKREFKKLIEVDKDNKKYILYEDEKTKNIYAGKIQKNKLKSLNDNEYIMLNNILERFN